VSFMTCAGVLLLLSSTSWRTAIQLMLVLPTVSLGSLLARRSRGRTRASVSVYVGSRAQLRRGQHFRVPVGNFSRVNDQRVQKTLTWPWWSSAAPSHDRISHTLPDGPLLVVAPR
jgi:hypothetical protein